jgi:hypothetical protein
VSARISIDFGNSYTKVAIRPDAESAARLMADASLSLDELNVCVPTLAARLERDGAEAWQYGTDVMRHRPETPGLTVHRNWKPLFFRGEETHVGGTPRRRPVAVTVGGPAEGTAARRLSDDQWRALQRQLGLPDVARGAIEAALRSAPEAPPEPPPAPETDPDTKQIGLGFFRWLREHLVQPVCTKWGLGAVQGLPVRISLPSFGAATRAELLLREILEEAGWAPDGQVPALAEPLANAIGTFTEGCNATHRRNAGTWPNYARMFGQTGLFQAMREAILCDGPKVAWAMIVDLGGYTADFAMIGLALDDIDARIEGEIDGKPRAAHDSEPIGVTALDERIRAALGDSAREAFAAIGRDPDQRRLETFHRTVYGRLRPYNLGPRGVIGAGAELDRIRDCVGQFAEEVADYAAKFLQVHQYDRIDDLILTGGGSMIPAVRDALCGRLRACGVRKTHTYFEPSASLTRDHHRLDQRLLRGATALGGASVYFDYAR